MYERYVASAVICLILDTGIRAREVCALEAYPDNASAWLIVNGRETGELGAYTRQALMNYVLHIRDWSPEASTLFVDAQGHAFTPKTLNALLARYGTKAEWLRHVYAALYRAHGGDKYTLASFLGVSVATVQRHYGKASLEKLKILGRLNKNGAVFVAQPKDGVTAHTEERAHLTRSV